MSAGMLNSTSWTDSLGRAVTDHATPARGTAAPLALERMLSFDLTFGFSAGSVGRKSRFAAV